MKENKDLSFMKVLNAEVKDYPTAKLEKLAKNLNTILEKRKEKKEAIEKAEQESNDIKRQIVATMLENKIKVPNELKEFIPKKLKKNKPTL